MRNSESWLSLRFGSISSNWNPQADHLSFCAVVFKERGDRSGLDTSLHSLASQSLLPGKVVIVIPPGDAWPSEWQFSTEPMLTFRSVAYGCLAACLLEEAADAFAFLHSGSRWLTLRLEHDDALLRNGATLAVLSLPLLVPRKGGYGWAPRDPFPATATQRGEERVSGAAVLEAIEGLDPGALLDCLSVRRDLLLPQLHRDDPSLLPGLRQGLKRAGDVRFSERCLTTMAV